MKIASLVKTSLLDFPGKIAAIVGTQGCNMRCPWCHNAHLIPYTVGQNTEVVDENDFFRFLRRRHLLLEGVVITGGEPTIQADLPAFCAAVKAQGFSVKLDTNGTNPDLLEQLLRRDLIDYLAMDIKTDLAHYPQLFRKRMTAGAVAASAALVLSSNIPYEFRTTCVGPFVDQRTIHGIGSLLKGAKKHYLQRCRDVPDPPGPGQYAITAQSDMMQLKRCLERYVVDCEIR